MEMSSSTPVRSDPLPDRLQPFAEILVDEEEQRINRVEGNENTQDDGEEREGSCCTMRKISTATSTQASQSARGSGPRTDAHPLPQLVSTLRTRSSEIRCASQTSKTKVRKKEDSAW